MDYKSRRYKFSKESKKRKLGGVGDQTHIVTKMQDSTSSKQKLEKNTSEIRLVFTLQIIQ